jgi:FKBP-type peptidyl-prolyl cis-trans isomerase
MKSIPLSLTAIAALSLAACNKTATPAEEPAAPKADAPADAANPAAPDTAATPAAPADGVKTTASGLKYEVMKSGSGTVHPKATDTVTVHYHGTLLNGKVFDSSVQRGTPASFPLNQVIKGWTEGVQLMKVGDKFKFTIPAELAYGASSPSPDIPPNSTLVFEVELLGIK